MKQLSVTCLENSKLNDGGTNTEIDKDNITLTLV